MMKVHARRASVALVFTLVVYLILGSTPASAQDATIVAPAPAGGAAPPAGGGAAPAAPAGSDCAANLAAAAGGADTATTCDASTVPAAQATATDAVDTVGGIFNFTEELVTKVENAIVAWFMDGAANYVMGVLTMITSSTTPVVNGNAQAGDWFGIQYQMMMNVGWWMMLPLIFITIIHSILKGSMQLLMRSMVMYLPMAVLGTVVATSFIQLLIQIVDDMCAVFVGLIGADLKNFGTAFAGSLEGSALGIILGAFVALILILFSTYLYLVFLLRDSSLYLAVMFMPVGFAMMVWPLAARYFRRMVEFLVGIILAKLVMVIIISLSVAALAGVTGTTTAGQAALAPNGSVVTTGAASGLGTVPTAGGAAVSGSGTAAIQGWAPAISAGAAAAPTTAGHLPGTATVDTQNPDVGTAAEKDPNNEGVDTGTGIWRRLGYLIPAMTMLALAALSPPMTIRLVGNLGIGQMAGQVADSLNTQTWLYQYIGAERFTRVTITNPTKMYRMWKEGKEIKRENKKTSRQEQMLNSMGIYRNSDGSFLNRKQLEDWDVPLETQEDIDRAELLMHMANESDDPNKVAAAVRAAQAGRNFDGFEGVHVRDSANGSRSVRLGRGLGTVVKYKDGTSDLIMDIADKRTLKPIDHIDTHLLRRAIANECMRQRNESENGMVQGVNVITPVQLGVWAGEDPKNAPRWVPAEKIRNNSTNRLKGKNYTQEKWAKAIERTVREANAENGTRGISVEHHPWTTIGDELRADPRQSVHDTLDHTVQRTDVDLAG